jgi:molybdopterin biosynthesis enzyme
MQNAAVARSPDDLSETGLLPVEEARTRILGALPVLDAEAIAIADALGRVAAADVLALLSQPPMPVSAMDSRAEHTRAGAIQHLPPRNVQR